MIIFYGWKSKTIKQAPLDNVACSNCGHEHTDLTIFSKYVHIFWIPFFPYGKSAVVSCPNCGHVAEEKSMAPEFRETVKRLKHAVPTPKYLFAGLGLAVVFCAFLFFQIRQDNALENEYLQYPVVGDVYKLKDPEEPSEYKYFLWKVAMIANDSIYVMPNSYNYNQLPTKLDPNDGFYDNVAFAFHKDELMELRTQGELKKVVRNYSDISGFNKVLTFTDSAQAQL